MRPVPSSSIAFIRLNSLQIAAPGAAISKKRDILAELL
jgi:hypothetical protein